jgi:hypothetical protein
MTGLCFEAPGSLCPYSSKVRVTGPDHRISIAAVSAQSIANMTRVDPYTPVSRRALKEIP